MPDLVIPIALLHLLDHDPVSLAQDLQALGRNFAQEAHSEAGAGERLAMNDFFRQAEFQSELAHFVFEQTFKRLHQLELHLLRQAADVVMALDHRRRITGDRHGFDHVGIKRSLRQEPRFANGSVGVARRIEPQARRYRPFKNFNECPADDFAFALRVGHALEPREKQSRRVFVEQPDAEVAAKHFLHDLSLARAEQTVVDENASKLVADGLVNQRRRHAGIHAAAQAEDDFLAADLRADFRDRLLEVVAHGPVTAAAADAVDEVAVDLAAARRVDDFRMKLQTVGIRRAVFDGCVIRISRRGHRNKSLRQTGEFVPVRIPDLERLGHVLEQRTRTVANR